VIMVMVRTEVEGKPARRALMTSEVVELNPKTKELKTKETFRWNPKEDVFSFSGYSQTLERNMHKLNIDQEEIRRELHRRKTVLEWMVQKGIRRYTNVANVIREYNANPKHVYQKARVGLK
jgi:flagellar protein FlaI